MRADRKLRGQEGGYVLIILVILTAAIVFGVLHALDKASLQTAQDTRTMQALQEAKETLIAYALTNSSAAPGRLPCPEDTTLIDSKTEGTAQTSCTNGDMHVGRLSWRTLRLPQQPDGTGEQFWYVVSPNIRSIPINSASTGGLSLNGQSNIAAIIIAPGPALDSQSRPTPTKAAPPLVSNYLDGSNADGDLAFYSNAAGTNDRAIGITVAELTTPVVRRVLAEIAGPNTSGAPAGTTAPEYGLRHYYASNGFFPATLDLDSLIDPAEAGWISNNGWKTMPISYKSTTSGAMLTLGSISLSVKPCALQPCP